jgi:hypothetical protein
MPPQLKTKHEISLWGAGTLGLGKGGLISESFSCWIQSPKKWPKDYPDHLLFWWVELRIFFFHIFWEIGAKVENYLR